MQEGQALLKDVAIEAGMWIIVPEARAAQLLLKAGKLLKLGKKIEKAGKVLIQVTDSKVSKEAQRLVGKAGGRLVKKGGKVIEKGAKVPVGRRGKGHGINVSKGTNTATIINGRKFSGHALDQMQGRGFVPAVVEDVVKHPSKVVPGNTPGTTMYIGKKLKVILNKAGDVVTVIHQ